MVAFNGDDIAATITAISPILLAIVGLVGAIISLAVAFAVIGLVRGILKAVTVGVERSVGGSF